MAQVRLPEPAPARVALARRLAIHVRALAGPRRRKAWVAAAGVALAPAITVGLIAYTVFSHPLVTVGSLATFVWLKGSAVAAALGGGVVTSLTQSATLFRAWTTLGTLISSPAAAGAALLAFSALTLTAVWVLYATCSRPLPMPSRRNPLLPLLLLLALAWCFAPAPAAAQLREIVSKQIGVGSSEASLLLEFSDRGELEVEFSGVSAAERRGGGTLRVGRCARNRVAGAARRGGVA